MRTTDHRYAVGTYLVHRDSSPESTGDPIVALTHDEQGSPTYTLRMSQTGEDLPDVPDSYDWHSTDDPCHAMFRDPQGNACCCNLGAGHPGSAHRGFVVTEAAPSDQALAQELRDAEAAGSQADGGERIVLALNAICDRLDLPLDHTEQGLTPWASERIDAFVNEALREAG